MSAVIEALQPVENLVIFRFRDRQKTIAQHEDILAAITDRDVQKTEQAITQQMRYLRKLFENVKAEKTNGS